MVDTSKFDSCRHRSGEEVTTTIKTCCQNSQIIGYICYKLNIFKLTPYACLDCKKYERKDGPAKILGTKIRRERNG